MLGWPVVRNSFPEPPAPCQSRPSALLAAGPLPSQAAYYAERAVPSLDRGSASSRQAHSGHQRPRPRRPMTAFSSPAPSTALTPQVVSIQSRSSGILTSRNPGGGLSWHSSQTSSTLLLQRLPAWLNTCNTNCCTLLNLEKQSLTVFPLLPPPTSEKEGSYFANCLNM